MNLPKSCVLDDALLLEQIGEGKAEAFNFLYERHWQKAYADAYRRLQDYDSAKDVVQEIFTHIWLKRDALHIENLPAYLAIAVRNKTLKLLAKQNLKHPFFDILESIPATSLKTDANLLWKEFFASYEALLKTLPEKRQIIFRLRFQENLSTKEIAEQMGITRKTVQNQLGKAVEQLRASLAQLLSIILILMQSDI